MGICDSENKKEGKTQGDLEEKHFPKNETEIMNAKLGETDISQNGNKIENIIPVETAVETEKNNIPQNENKIVNVIDESLHINKQKEMEEIIEKCIIKKTPIFENIDPNFTNVSKSICKIIIRTKGKETNGTGFLLKFWILEDYFYCLMSNEHVIKEDFINNNNIINISYDSEFKHRDIKLDEKKRYMKSFKKNGLDITVVEIIEKDNISKDYFLIPEMDINNKRLINSQIYVPQYAGGKELTNGRGKIMHIDQNYFTYIAPTIKGSSGSPIFLGNTIKVIGIHKGNIENGDKKYANFIYRAIDVVKSDISRKTSNGQYVGGEYITEHGKFKGRYNWDNGKYYLGQFKNKLPNGKGIKYEANNKILYEGDFMNGKFEGKGIFYYIYDDNIGYCKGQFKNGLLHGEGKTYFRNGNISIDGNYINDKLNGKGKCFYPNGNIMYDGNFINDKFEGNGKIYYENGKIKYEGEFINDKFEGNGKYIWKGGEYYIGQWKNGLKHGRGKLYYKNGNLMYNGDFINDKFEGNGKYIWKDGGYYEGQWKNGLKDGKGLCYYKNGNIKYEGYFVNNNIKGDGRFIWEDGIFYICKWKNGLLHGKGKQYNKNGKIISEDNWINGKLINKR